jgi:hypothetical protein
MGIGTKILNFFPDQKGQIPVHDKNLYSPSPRVLFVFYGMEKFIDVPQFSFAFQTVQDNLGIGFLIILPDSGIILGYNKTGHAH